MDEIKHLENEIYDLQFQINKLKHSLKLSKQLLKRLLKGV